MNSKKWTAVQQDHTCRSRRETTRDIRPHHRVQSVRGTGRQWCPFQCGSGKTGVTAVWTWLYHAMFHYTVAASGCDIAMVSCDKRTGRQWVSHAAVECWLCRPAQHLPVHSTQCATTTIHTHTAHDDAVTSHVSCLTLTLPTNVQWQQQNMHETNVKDDVTI